MRELNSRELHQVAGGGNGGSCPSDSASNDFSGITDTGQFGRDLINLYEGAVDATSHIIERVAVALRG